MRETINEAQATVEELKTLAEGWSTLSIEQMFGAGRWGGRTRAERREMLDRVKAVLSRLGVDQDEALETIAFRFDHFDYVQDVLTACSSEDVQLWRDTINAYHKSHEGIGSEAGPDELEHILETAGILTPNARELILDYRQFDQTKTHRRPSVWYVA